MMFGLMAAGFAQPTMASEREPEEVRGAVVKAISLIEASSQEYLKRRECFSCHHQAMPMVMLSEARRRGFEVNEENFQAQLQRTLKHLEGGRKQYDEGKGQGGRVDTAAWALWGLEAGEHPADDTTAAVAQYLLDYRKENRHWNPPGNRPPTGASNSASTYVALRGVGHFATPKQQEQLETRRERVAQWLETAEPKDTEDRVYRLRTLSYLGTDDEKLQAAVDDLLKRQREDGGWSQTDEMESDAYATGTALVALHEVGGLAVTDERYQKGIAYLLKTQEPDGSWKVETRSKAIQTYFESGFPHKKGQFVSIAASSWAATALLFTFPETKAAGPES
jgi:hypothetical protein